MKTDLIQDIIIKEPHGFKTAKGYKREHSAIYIGYRRIVEKFVHKRMYPADIHHIVSKAQRDEDLYKLLERFRTR
jgi:hypothetical protein